MDGNNFSSIPPSLLQLRRLTVLVLSYNRLVTLALAHITWCAALVSADGCLSVYRRHCPKVYGELIQS
jgi:Leucine-rich repeat (LRR) protein